jgi:hypothetical protein
LGNISVTLLRFRLLQTRRRLRRRASS